MNAVAIGPFALSIDRLAVIMGIVAFLLAATLLARRGPPQFQQWTTYALFGGIAGARLGHVVRHTESFTAEPWRIVAFWEGGFAWDGAAVGVMLPTLLLGIHTLPAPPRAALALITLANGWAATASLAFIGPSPSAPLGAFSNVDATGQVVDRRPTRPAGRGQTLGKLVPALSPGDACHSRCDPREY
jgi:prolipoprotein diacylglyceryltransferase